MEKNVLEWLECSAEKYPEAVAFADENDRITFAGLRDKAQAVGTWLLDYVDRNEPVAFYLEKSVKAITGMFGAVYAGGFYSLMDVRQPEARLQKIAETLEPAVIFADDENIDKAREMFPDRKVFMIEEIIASAEKNMERLAAVREAAQDIDPLYVNFTSGSTGTPKGVTICHRSVIDFIPELVKVSGMKQDDIIGNQAPFDFDVSVKDIYSGIYLGAQVHIIPRSYFSNPTKLMDYLCERRCTVLIWAVSAMCFVSIMNGFSYKLPADVRLIMFSGEVMPNKQLNVWKKYLPHAQYVNLYGPTEITCNCTYYKLEDREYALDEVIPIGIPFANEKVFLLDENDKLIDESQEGVTGEICVSGTCVGLGYYKDRQKTNEAFVQNPLNTKYNEIIYRTGDLGKYNDKQELLYVSRKDFQIKHLGHRIELGEIEAQVQAVDDVTRACCIYDSVKKRILLFYTGSKDKKELQETLKTVLPPFMCPNKMFQLETMPMTKNGKIDRNELKKTGGIQ